MTLRNNKNRAIFYAVYLCAALLAVITASVLLAPKASANYYPSGPSGDHFSVVSKASTWGPSSSGGGSYNCKPSIYPGGQDEGACATGLDAGGNNENPVRYKIFIPNTGSIPATDIRVVDGCKGVNSENLTLRSPLLGLPGLL